MNTASMHCSARLLHSLLTLARFALGLACAVLCGFAGAATDEWTLAEGALVHPPYRGQVPNKSDVIFSSRFLRPEAAKVAKAFDATRIEWTYATDPTFVASLKGVTPWVGGTLNANPKLPSDAGYAMDFDGVPLVAPWMKSWGAKWATTIHPDTNRLLFKRLADFKALGISSLQIDDPLLQLYSAQDHAGDFNPATQQGFSDYLTGLPDIDKVKALGLDDYQGDYRAYLKKRHNVKDAADYKRRFRTFGSTELWLDYIKTTVRDHFIALRDQLHSTSGQPIALSMNLALDEPDEKNRSFFLAEYADYLMAETPITSTQQMLIRAATARALGVGFVPSILPKTLQENRVAIATLYAMGGTPVVPWDTYTGAGPRYFGTPTEYSDLYEFAQKKKLLWTATKRPP